MVRVVDCHAGVLGLNPGGPKIFPRGITSVKYLFDIFYLCVVMFLNVGHQLAKGETCGAGRRGNARYINANKTEVKLTTNLFPLMTFRSISLYMGSLLSSIYAIIYDRVFPRFPGPVQM